MPATCLTYALIEIYIDLQRQQEMLQHQQSQGHWLSHLETAPTFYPTPDEFQDPIAYIRSIQTEGSKHGELAGPPKFALRSTKLLMFVRNMPASQVYAKLFLHLSRPYPAAW